MSRLIVCTEANKIIFYFSTVLYLSNTFTTKDFHEPSSVIFREYTY